MVKGDGVDEILVQGHERLRLLGGSASSVPSGVAGISFLADCHVLAFRVWDQKPTGVKGAVPRVLDNGC